MNNKISGNTMSGFFMYGRRILRLAAIVVLLPTLGYGQEPVAPAENVATEPVAMLRFPPLPVLTQKIMDVARVVQPGPETEMVPLFLLGAMGYPNFPGISETDNVTVFLLENHGDTSDAMPIPVILAKIAPDSPARNAIAGYGMQMQDREDGWTLIAMNPDAFNLVGNVSELVAKAQSPKDYDIELMVEINAARIEKWMIPFTEGFVEVSFTNLQGDLDAEELKALMQGVSAFLKACLLNFENAKLGIDISVEEVGMGFAMQAVEGTPEATVFSSQAGGDVPVAKYLSADAMVVYAGQSEIQPWTDYLDVIQERLVTHIQHENVKPILNIVYEMLDGMDPFSGDWVATMDIDVANENMSARYLYGGDFNEREIIDLYYRMTNERLPELWELLGGNFSEAFNYSFKENVASHNGVAMHEFGLNSDLTSMGVEEKTRFSNQDLFLSVVDGNLLMTHSVDDLKALIDTVKAGKPVAQSVAEQVTLDAGQAIKYLVDLRSYAQIIFDVTPELSSPATKMALEAFTAAEIEPLSGDYAYADGQVSVGGKVPVASIAKVAKAYRSIKQATTEQALQQQAIETQTQQQQEAEETTLVDPDK